MRLGVLDIGSNTVHLLIVDARPGAHPLPASSFKHQLRLAEFLTPEGDIDDAGAETLAAFATECLDHAADLGAVKVLGFATSAIRDAGNTDAVLARVREASGVDLQVLSGEEEARLTFLAARRWHGWSAGRITNIDIGGGSLEMSTGTEETPDLAVSLDLGAGRLTHQWFDTDPPERKKINLLRDFIDAELAALAEIMERFGSDRVRLTPQQKYIRGLFCGGTLCDEAMFAALKAAGRGERADKVMAAALRPYRRRTKANVRRLSKKT